MGRRANPHLRLLVRALLQSNGREHRRHAAGAVIADGIEGTGCAPGTQVHPRVQAQGGNSELGEDITYQRHGNTVTYQAKGNIDDFQVTQN